MKTRKEMIKELTEYELKYYLNNSYLTEELTEFFSGGGFSNMDDDKLEILWKDRFID